MDSLDAAIFAKLVVNNSFKLAGQQLGVSRSAVSKRIAKLEDELGVTLVNRSPRSMVLTEAGRKFAEHCVVIQRAIEDAESAVRQQDESPTGTLRFSLPSSLGAALMPRIMTDFVKRYPLIRPCVHFAEPFVDVIAGGYDVVIRIASKLQDSSLVAQNLFSTPKVLVASPGYLDEHGVPHHPRELKRRACLGLTYDAEMAVTWHFEGPDGAHDVPIVYTFSANNDLTLVLAACMDGGFLYLPRLLVGSEIVRDRLKVVLPDFARNQGYNVYAVYPQKSPPAKVKVFVDFIRDALVDLDQADRWNPLSS